jgi:hypothetical protein
MNDIENSMVLDLGAPPGWEPDPVLCACGKAEPLDHFDSCLACEVEFHLAHPEDFDDNFPDEPADESSRLIYRAVVRERIARFAAGKPVYPPDRAAKALLLAAAMEFEAQLRETA